MLQRAVDILICRCSHRARGVQVNFTASALWLVGFQDAPSVWLPGTWKLEGPKCSSERGSADVLARLLLCLESGISSFLFTFLTQL